MLASRFLRFFAVCLVAFSLSPTFASPRRAPRAHGRMDAASSIAFASRRDGNWEIYVVDAGGQSRRLTTRTVEDRFPLWSPDGSQIAFGSQVGADWSWELWVMDADGTHQRRLHAGIVAKSSRGWCRGNNRIAFAANTGGNIEIFTVDPASSAVTRVTTAPGEDRDPSWSPDCQHLVFSSARDANAEIYIARADGSDVRRLTSDAASDSSPAWSPDGSLIAFVSARSGAADVYAIRPDGSGLQRLTVDAGSTRDALQWSPDGSQIAFQIARGKNYDIGVVRVADRRHTDIARSAGYDGMYAWSPNSLKIAFVSDRDGFDGLYTVGANGQRAQRLTETPSLNPAWAPQ